jgi:hypothetical protein
MDYTNRPSTDPSSPGADRIVFSEKMLLIQEEPRGASILIEVACAANGLSELPLPLIQQLQTDPTQIVVIKGLRLVPIGELNVAPRSGNANAPITELQKLTLMLYSDGWEKGFRIPILALNNTFIEGSGLPFRDRSTKLANWQKVDWNKSTLYFNNGTVSVGAAYSVLFEVEYVRFDNQGKEIWGPTG